MAAFFIPLSLVPGLGRSIYICKRAEAEMSKNDHLATSYTNLILAYDMFEDMLERG